jgi:hypothetical protein
MHFGNPVYVDLSKPQEVIIRFATKECLTSFMAKASENGKEANRAFLQAMAVQVHGQEYDVKTVKLAIMSSAEV